MMEFKEVTDIQKKLLEIGFVTSDAYYFLKMSVLLEDWQQMSEQGDQKAQEAMRMVDMFYRLCLAVKSRQ